MKKKEEITEIPLMIKVKSSAIKTIGYDEKTNTLYVEFKNRHIYMYLNVFNEEQKGFLSADSKGKYFNRKIKKKYLVKKIF